MNKLVLPLFVMFCATTSYAQFDYQKVLKKYIENQLKTSPCAIDKNFKEFKKWQVMNYPTNNFGLLTLYDQQPDQSYSLLTDMWATLGYKTEEIPTVYTKWFGMDGFAAPGGDGPQIVITKDEDKKKFGLGFVFPKLLGLMGLDIGFNKDTTTVVDLQIESFGLRCLRRPQANAFLNGVQPNAANGRSVDSTVKTNFQQGDLAIVVGDVIAKNMTVTIKPDLTTTGKVETKFGEIANKVFDSAELKFNYERKQKGEYKFTVTSPVVVARLIKVQPEGGASGESKYFEDWDVVDLQKVPAPKLH